MGALELLLGCFSLVHVYRNFALRREGHRDPAVGSVFLELVSFDASVETIRLCRNLRQSEIVALALLLFNLSQTDARRALRLNRVQALLQTRLPRSWLDRPGLCPGGNPDCSN
jgi:hypothetical protein